jgi:hypothetical protein
MLVLKNAYLAGIPPEGFLAKLICKILKAKTFHWLIIVGENKFSDISNCKYITSESLGKGTSIARFNYPKAYIYRIKGLRHEPYSMRLIGYHSLYGDTVYDMQVNILTGIWFLLKHYLKIVIPVIRNHTFNCQEHVIYMASMLGVKLIPDDEYPYCVNLENSDYLEFLGEYNESN